jgi:hypothetical protein
MRVNPVIWTTSAKASAASRSILYDFLGSVRALAWVELKCDILFLSGGKPRKEVPMFLGFHFIIRGYSDHTFCILSLF